MNLVHRFLLLLPFISTLTFALSKDAPNIIIIVADDLGWADVSFRGSEIETPALDSIAAQGMQLDRFYTAPICSPTRAALMTGRNPIRLGVAYATIKPWDNLGIHPKEHFMPQAFKNAGYQTAMIGKWHLGHSQQAYHPNQRGFEHFYGHLHTEVGYYPPFASQQGKDFQFNGNSIEVTGKREDNYETFLLAKAAKQYILSRDTNKPFFMYIPFLAPHTPLDAPLHIQEKYKNINTQLPSTRSPRTDRMHKNGKFLFRKNARPMYAAVVDAMDQAIGTILNTLEQQGLDKNTIVLFFSDNGGATYPGGGASNYPLRGGKGEVWEGGIRVNALIKWPNKIKSGSVNKNILSVMDVFPTLAAASGVNPGNQLPLEGKNVLNTILYQQKMPLRNYLFFVSESPIFGHFNITLFNEKWKLIQIVEQNQLHTKVVHQLYQISEDPYEYNDVSQLHPNIVTKMSAEIKRMRALHPINGMRSRLVPPPGWRAPLDWATYPTPESKLHQRSNLISKDILKRLDKYHGERGRLIYEQQ